MSVNLRGEPTDVKEPCGRKREQDAPAREQRAKLQLRKQRAGRIERGCKEQREGEAGGGRQGDHRQLAPPETGRQRQPEGGRSRHGSKDAERAAAQ